jgi:hypothetical protein
VSREATSNSGARSSGKLALLLLAQEHAPEAAVLVRDITEALAHDFDVGEVAVGDGERVEAAGGLSGPVLACSTSTTIRRRADVTHMPPTEHAARVVEDDDPDPSAPPKVTRPS